MDDHCHFCKVVFHDRDIPVSARLKYLKYSGEEFHVYIKMCRSCATTLNHGAEILDPDSAVELVRQDWREGNPAILPTIEPAVRGEQMTIDEAGQGSLFEDENLERPL